MLFVIANWDQQISSSLTTEFCHGLSRRLIKRIKSKELRDYLTTCIDGNCLYSLCHYGVAYHRSDDDDAAILRQILAFFEKRSDIDIGIDRSLVAKKAFIESESACRSTNRLFTAIASGKASHYPHSVSTDLWVAAAFIADVLGPCPDLSEIVGRFGPGATTQIPKRIASVRRKLSQPLACSEDLLPSLKEVLGGYQGFLDRKEFVLNSRITVSVDPRSNVLSSTEDDYWTVPVEVHTGKLAFVPKNAKTDRAVVVEPWLNSFVQLGLGDAIAVRLSRNGMSITDQSRNQALACAGSLSNLLATIDLSSASDTISYELVKDLLPDDWFEALCRCRSSSVTCEGFTFKQEKFSSMGNGFTFPLETLIFWALAHAASDGAGLVSVYGDDIICESKYYDRVTKLLNHCGFKANMEKSFSDGPFRESCGADFLLGTDIRPSYIKRALTGHDLFRLHNFFYRKGDAEMCHAILVHIDPSIRLWGPDGYGDGHLLGGNLPPRSYKRERGWSGFVFDTFVFVGARDFRLCSGDHILPLYSTYAREGVSGATFGRVVVHRDILRSFALAFRPESPTAYIYDRGALGVSIPGVVGYKRISVYTLSV